MNRRRLLGSALVAWLAAMTLVPMAPPRPAAAASFSDIGSSPFLADIEWLVERGITNGCGDGRFCPLRPVTREQMASFLVRMFVLPPSDVDRFTDDAGSLHEADINALAAAGITTGCTTTAFCPQRNVSRAEMATFLDRAASFPATSADYFLDDDRSFHQVAINEAAAVGVTRGCDVHLYCPTRAVLREQMAAFLHRVEVPAAPATPLPAVGPMPACRYDDLPTSRTTLSAWSSTLLDTIYMLPSTYVPTDLVDTSTVGLNGGYRVRSIVATDLAALAAAARAAGRPIAAVSAYRSYATQEAVFADNVAKYGLAVALRRSARPGHSEHQLGTTLDVTHAGGSAPWDYADWATHPTGAWMRDNAWRYGFVMSYPKDRSVEHCYDYEPWHYRYIGRANAAHLQASGLTLREWIWRRYGP